MNARWAARVMGILLIIGFILLMAHLQKKLAEMQEMRQGAPTSTR
jgi:hypothetical protein